VWIPETGRELIEGVPPSPGGVILSPRSTPGGLLVRTRRQIECQLMYGPPLDHSFEPPTSRRCWIGRRGYGAKSSSPRDHFHW
jgi:hypothetical protein